MSNNALKTAFAVSLSIHILAMSSWDSFFSGMSHEEKKNAIEVTYIVRQLKEDRIVTNIPKNYGLEQRKTQTKKNYMEKIEEMLKEIQKETPENAVIQDNENFIEAENLEEYISYYQLLRERIRGRVSELYSRPSKEGEVHIIFTLGKKGDLKKIAIDEMKSTRNRYLRQIAVKSLRKAAPFSSFPEALKKQELVFNITIIFKRK